MSPFSTDWFGKETIQRSLRLALKSSKGDYRLSFLCYRYCAISTDQRVAGECLCFHAVGSRYPQFLPVLMLALPRCWISTSDVSGERIEEAAAWRFIQYYGPLWVCITVIVSIYLYIIVSLRKTIKARNSNLLWKKEKGRIVADTGTGRGWIHAIKSDEKEVEGRAPSCVVPRYTRYYSYSVHYLPHHGRSVSAVCYD